MPEIELRNGSRIVSLPTSADRITGFSPSEGIGTDVISDLLFRGFNEARVFHKFVSKKDYSNRGVNATNLTSAIIYDTTPAIPKLIQVFATLLVQYQT